MGGDPINVLENSSDVSDASSHTEIVNLKMENVTHLGVNRSIRNLIFLSVSLGSSEGSIKDDNDLSSYHIGGNTHDSVGLLIKDTNIDHYSLELV